MPEYLIEDTATGLKFAVEGDAEPTQEDAAELETQVVEQLTKNIHRAPGNRIMLDVGPLSEQRANLDRLTKMENEFLGNPNLHLMESLPAARIKLEEEMKHYTFSNFEEERDFRSKLHGRLIDQEAARLAQADLKANRQAIPTEAMLQGLPENTLLIQAHGAETGGFSTDDSKNFTLHNLAIILGQSTNSIRNVFNTACYGAACKPQDFESLFPNVTNIVQTPTNVVNVVSVRRMQRQEHFTEGMEPTNWQKIGANWIEQPVIRNNPDEKRDKK